MADVAGARDGFVAIPGGLVIDGKPVKFVSPPLESQLCLFCKGVLQDPVLSIRCGHTFCRACCNKRMVNDSGKCPVEETPFSSESLVVNVALASQIGSLLVYCRYGVRNDEVRGEWSLDENGCPQTVRFSGRNEHEAACDFAKLPCPHDEARCGNFRRKMLQSHIENCPNTPCPNAEQGCRFRGDPESVAQHHRICSLSLELNSAEKVKDALSKLLENHHELQGKHDQLKREFDARLAQQREERQQWQQERKNILSRLDETRDELQRVSEHCGELERRLESVVKTLPQGYRMRNRDSTSSVAALVENGGYGTSPSLAHRSLLEEAPATSTVTRTPSNPKPERNRASALAARPTNLIVSWEHQMPFKFKCIGTFKGHQHTVWKLISHGSTLYSADGSGTIKVWDMNNLLRGCVHTIPVAHSEAILAMATNGEFLFTAGSDLSIIGWDCKSLKKVSSAKDAHDDDIDCLEIIGDFLFSTSHSKIKVWDIHSLQHKHTMQGLHHRVRALVYDRKRERLYSGSHNVIHVWDAVEPFSLLARIDTKFGSIFSLVITKKYLATGTYNRNVHLYDIETHEYIHALSGHLGAVATMGRSPTGSFLVTGSHDSTLQVWDLEKALPYQILQRHESCVNTILVRSDLLFSGSDDKEIKVFKLFRQQDYSAS
ncbi:E3 ubiquitin-protein ligase TRAF7-like [Sycon ciliatum]|uniref:E3 ubiquitin-protein ligase TRAF7-like n=1 Tax=Sycon ciliatum TaxID=27933 RepID=UPI0020A9EFED